MEKVSAEMLERLKWQHGGADIMGEEMVRIRKVDGEALRSLAEAVIAARPALERAADELDLLTAEEFAALRSVLEMLEP